MTRVVAVLGTATDIGKTWATAAVIVALRERGFACSARKPAQSFDPSDEHPTDAAALSEASGEAPETVCPPHRWYPTPMAPPMAAHALGAPEPTLAELVAETHIALGDFVFVETAGGVRSPIASDGDCLAYATALTPHVVLLCADAGLGTINAVRLCHDAIATLPCIVFLNRYNATSELHVLNAEWLKNVDGFNVVTSISELAEALCEPRFGTTTFER